MSNIENSGRSSLLQMASAIVAGYVSKNLVPVGELQGLITTTFGTLAGLDSGGNTAELKMTQKPAVPIKKSVTPDFVICLEDGKKLKMLKRYLRSRYSLTP